MTSPGSLGPAAGDLLNTIIGDTAIRPNQQTEIVMKAMVPIVKRAMVSKNKAVFQASLDSMKRIEQMFGQETIDTYLETLVEGLEKQCGKAGGDDRSALVFDMITQLCSKDAAAGLHKRFPEYAAAAVELAAKKQAKKAAVPAPSSSATAKIVEELPASSSSSSSSSSAAKANGAR
jgi:hypothetical protein